MINLKNLQNKKIAILGYAREGQASAHFLLQQGIAAEHITILDQQEKEIPTGIKGIFGDEHNKYLDQYDLIFRSAGISPQLEIFQGIKDKITTQTQFFFDNYQGKVIGITGTKGKTTISTLIYQTLKNAGLKVTLVGNIGKPLLNEIDRDQAYDYVIFELSSYMLDGLDYELEIGIVNNLYHEHHVDRHGGSKQYKQAKFSIIEKSKNTLIGSQLVKVSRKDMLVAHPHVMIYGSQGHYTRKEGYFWKDKVKLCSDEKMLLPGLHNRENACAVLGICDILCIDTKYFIQTLATFSGVEHRLEDIGIYHGIRWIDDAIATTPQSTIAALDTYQDEIDTIFLGGKDGGYDFSELVKKLEQYKIRNIILFPDSGEKIKKLLCYPELFVEGCSSNNYNIYHTSSMSEAVQFAKQHTQPGKIALLSCASPSYGLWKDFEEKGRFFKEEVRG